MRIAAFAAALTFVAAPAFASDLPAAGSTPVVAHAGDMLRDANNLRLSAVDTVNKDGSVGIIYNGRVVTVPAASLSLANGKLVTSLTKSQVNGL
jgi:hypothetical protein